MNKEIENEDCSETEDRFEVSDYWTVSEQDGEWMLKSERLWIQDEPPLPMQQILQPENEN